MAEFSKNRILPGLPGNPFPAPPPLVHKGYSLKAALLSSATIRPVRV